MGGGYKWKWKSLSLVWLFATPIDYTVKGILQARILGWVAFPFSKGSSQPRDWTQVSTLQADSLPAEPRGKLGGYKSVLHNLFQLHWILERFHNKMLEHYKNN